MRPASRPASTASSSRSTSDPREAKSDAQNALRLDLLEPLLDRLVRIDDVCRARARFYEELRLSASDGPAADKKSDATAR